MQICMYTLAGRQDDRYTVDIGRQAGRQLHMYTSAGRQEGRNTCTHRAGRQEGRYTSTHRKGSRKEGIHVHIGRQA